MTDFRAVGRYVQRAGAMETIGADLAGVSADRALVVGGTTALSTVEDPLRAGLTDAGIVHAGTIRGIAESTADRADAIADRVTDDGCDLVVGVGGCTAIDAAKAGAYRSNVSFVAVPTLASADGPAGGLAVLYDDAGRPVDVELGPRNPALVVVDTAVVAEAPVHFLRWGLGDAISTRFEAAACEATDATTIHDLEPATAGRQLARTTYEVIARDGERAIDDVGRDAVTPAVESIVETVHLTSVLGWENAGLAGAHALETGLRASGITEPPHGLLVAVCTLAETIWQDHPATDEVAALLVDLGFDDPIPADADLAAGAEVACTLPMMANEPVEVTPARAVDALETARRRLS